MAYILRVAVLWNEAMAVSLPVKVVIFERREDGGLRVHSDDVPGFVLSHSDPMAVLSDVKPALEQILSHIHGVPIEVRQLAETIPTQLRDYGCKPLQGKGPLNTAEWWQMPWGGYPILSPFLLTTMGSAISGPSIS
jgi:hypothetical protein